MRNWEVPVRFALFFLYASFGSIDDLDFPFLKKKNECKVLRGISLLRPTCPDQDMDGTMGDGGLCELQKQ